jgi:hypothetical protein
MQCYSEDQIRTFHSEFKSHKKYADKLIYFDRIFGIVPFSFPGFDSQLRFFFQKAKTDELVSIFKNERNNPGLTEKKFSFDETFVFNINPANSNSSTYSNFILSRFLSQAPAFEDLIARKITAEKPLEFFLDEANGLINQIEYCIQNENNKNFAFQCMPVFFKGFEDAFRNRVNLPGKKRKFIELYLYAQGIIYADYIGSLKKVLYKSLNPLELRRSFHLDLTGKLALLHEQGIIDFLKNKYAGLDVASIENKVAEIICQVTGEYAEQKESVLNLLATMNSKGSGRNSKTPLRGSQGEITRNTTGK